MGRWEKMSRAKFRTHVRLTKKCKILFFCQKKLSFYFVQCHLEMFGLKWNAVHWEGFGFSGEIQSCNGDSDPCSWLPVLLGDLGGLSSSLGGSWNVKLAPCVSLALVKIEQQCRDFWGETLLQGFPDTLIWREFQHTTMHTKGDPKSPGIYL